MRKIAIDTVYGEQNYGNKLQNYALVKIFESLGFSVETLQVYQSVLIQSSFILFKKRIKQILSLLPIKSWRKNIIDREKGFKTFSRRYLNLSKKYNTHNFDWSYIKQFDFISVGSDQVWNDINFDIYDAKYYSLYNCKEYPSLKKFSFAASIGKRNFQSKYLDLFAESLNTYMFLSCREEAGSKYLEKILNKKCYTFLDPTLFLKRSDWEKILLKPKWFKNNKYSLAYFLGGHQEGINLGSNVVDLMDRNRISYTSSPEEFLFLIKNAEIIYTDSFHACVFSMIFKKKFVIYKRQRQLTDMSSRIDSLFETFNIQKRYDEMIFPEDYCEFESIRGRLVDQELEILRLFVK